MKLTEIQIKVVELLKSDYTQKEIAEKLKVNVSEINNITKELRDIFNVKTVHGLIFQYVDSLD